MVPPNTHDEFTALIPIRRRDGVIHAHALIYLADLDDVSRYTWRLLKGRDLRAVRRQGKHCISLSRHLMGLQPGDRRQVDHINHNTLDDRRSNLRIVTNGENCQNKGAYSDSRTGVRGVYWNKDRQKWHAQTCLNGRKYHLGYFADITEAKAVIKTWRRENMPYSEIDH